MNTEDRKVSKVSFDVWKLVWSICKNKEITQDDRDILLGCKDLMTNPKVWDIIYRLCKVSNIPKVPTEEEKIVLMDFVRLV